MGVTT
jgi:DNA replication protein DnaC